MIEKIIQLRDKTRMADCYDELIHLFISVTKKSSAAYASAVVIYIWCLYPYIPAYILVPWSIIQILYPIIRLYLAHIYKDVEFTPELKERFQYQHIIFVFTGGLLWGLGSVLCAVYAPSPYEYVVLTLIIGLSAGSLSTLSPLYRAYLAFNLPALLLMLFSFLLYGDTLHYVLSFMIGIFLIIVPSATWDIHKNYKRSVELNNLYSQAQKDLKEVNTLLKIRVAKEVEENRQKDRQMLEQSRLAQMGEMLSMIAHQWRQPLAAISATTGSMTLHMQLEELDETYIEDNIEKINTYVQYLSTTINDFRDFFKPNKEKVSTNLNEIVQGAIQIIGPSLESEGIRVETFLDSKEEFLSYPNELKQVVLNLLKNAKDVFNEKRAEGGGKYAFDEARVLIKTIKQDNRLELKICDNAGGVAEDILPKVFDPYFTTKEKLDGTGLGLYMSKLIVEEHCKGELKVENIEEGACFTLSFTLEKSV